MLPSWHCSSLFVSQVVPEFDMRREAHIIIAAIALYPQDTHTRELTNASSRIKWEPHERELKLSLVLETWTGRELAKSVLCREFDIHTRQLCWIVICHRDVIRISFVNQLPHL